MPTLADARAALAKALETHLGKRKWALFPDARTLDTPTKPTVQLIRTRVRPIATAPRSGVRESTFALQYIAPADATDDDLEGWLEELLDAIDKTTDIVWESADRGVWPAEEPTNPAYTIPFTRVTS